MLSSNSDFFDFSIKVVCLVEYFFQIHNSVVQRNLHGLVFDFDSTGSSIAQILVLGGSDLKACTLIRPVCSLGFGQGELCLPLSEFECVNEIL